MARVLVVTRLSRDSETSTAIERQTEHVTDWAIREGHEVVEVVEDSEVSGMTAPWDRPQLGQWLPDLHEQGGKRYAKPSRVDDFDIIAGYRLDRISRRVTHTATLVEWAKESGKVIVSTSEGIASNNTAGQLMFSIIATMAQAEWEAIAERIRGSRAHLARVGRWPGGIPPFGYKAVDDPDGKGRILVPDDEGENATAPIVREMVRRILAGDSAASVARWLDGKGVPTSRDAHRLREGKPAKGGKWSNKRVIDHLRSEVILGHSYTLEEWTTPEGEKRSRYKVVRDQDGMPLVRAEPLISPETFRQLQDKLDANGMQKERVRHDRAPLLHVAFCHCGAKLYRNPVRKRSKAYYRCSSLSTPGLSCGTKPIRADDLEAVVNEWLMTTVGHVEIVKREFVPGVNNDAEIAAVDRALADLVDDREAGLFSTERGKQDYRERYARLEARRERLASMPIVPDTWRETPTGETYAEMWARLETSAERNRELVEAGVRVVVHAEDLSPVLSLVEVGQTEGDITKHVGRVALTRPILLGEWAKGRAA